MQFSIIAVNLKTKKAKADPNDEGVGEGKMPGLRYKSCLIKIQIDQASLKSLRLKKKH